MIGYIGHRIQKIRESKGLDAKKVADELGIWHTSFSKIEREGSNSVKTLLKIAEVLEVKISDFFEDPQTVADPAVKMGYVDNSKFEELKKVVEILVKRFDEEFPIKRANNSYKAKAKKTSGKK